MDKEIQIENEHILHGIRQGDEVIIKKIFTSCLPSVKSLIARQGGLVADAEDVFMDAMEAIYTQLQSTGLKLERASFKTYLTQVCLFQWSKKKRKKKWETPVTNDELKVQKDTLDLSESLAEVDRIKLFRMKLDLLGMECQNILQWCMEEGRSMKEIAGILNISEVFARKKKFECKQRLFKMVQEDPLYHELKYPE